MSGVISVLRLRSDLSNKNCWKNMPDFYNIEGKKGGAGTGCQKPCGQRCTRTCRLRAVTPPAARVQESVRMRSEEIENAYPRLVPLLAQARLDFREGRRPYACSPALLAAMARAASAAGLTALGQLPAGQLRELLESCGGAELLEKWGADDAELQRAHAQLAALSGCELLALLNFHDNALNEGLSGPAPQFPLLIPAYFTYALDAYLGAAQLQGGKVLITDAIAHGPALLRLVRRHPRVNFALEVDAGFMEAQSKNDIQAAVALAYQDCPHVTLQDSLRTSNMTTGARARSSPWPGSPNLIVHLSRGVLSPVQRGVTPEAMWSVARLSDYAHAPLPGGQLITAISARLAGSRAASCAALRIHLSANMSLHELCELPQEVNFYADPRPAQACLLVLGAYDAPPPHLTISRFEPGGTETELSRPLPPLRRNIISEDLAYADFRALENWRVKTMLAAAAGHSRRQFTSSLKWMRLDELADIRRGVVIRPEEYVAHSFDYGNADAAWEDHYFHVISTSCLYDGIVNYTNAPTAFLPQRGVHDALFEGDILVTIRGSSVRVALVRDACLPCIATSNLAVIRPIRGALARNLYLLLFLQSPPGLELLRGLSDSNRKSQLNIRYRAMGGLEIPIPPREWMEDLLREYDVWQKEFIEAEMQYSEAQRRWEERQEYLQHRVLTCVQQDGAVPDPETAQPADEQEQRQGACEG